MNWIILPVDQHTKKRESSGGILDKLDNSLVDEHTKKKNYPDESLDNSFLGEIHPEESEPYVTASYELEYTKVLRVPSPFNPYI